MEEVRLSGTNNQPTNQPTRILREEKEVSRCGVKRKVLMVIGVMSMIICRVASFGQDVDVNNNPVYIAIDISGNGSGYNGSVPFDVEQYKTKRDYCCLWWYRC